MQSGFSSCINMLIDVKKLNNTLLQIVYLYFKYKLLHNLGLKEIERLVSIQISGVLYSDGYTNFIFYFSDTVPCRPGYMCDQCGFVAGTGVHLRNHLVRSFFEKKIVQGPFINDVTKLGARGGVINKLVKNGASACHVIFFCFMSGYFIFESY